MMNPKTKRNTVNDVYPNWSIGEGIFSDIMAQADMPWKDEVDAITLDYDYHGNHSGDKEISGLIGKLLTTNGLTTVQKQTIAKVIVARFNRAWTAQWNVLVAKYDPLFNYDMTETTDFVTNKDSETENITENGTNTRTYGRTDNNTETHSGNVVEGTQFGKTNNSTSSISGTTNTDTDTANNVFGFNSSTAVPQTSGKVSDESSNSTNGNTTSTDGGTNTTTTTDTTKIDHTAQAGGSDSDTDSKTTGRTRSHDLNTTQKLTRKGNIGVTTSQQMAESELKLRQWNFFENIFNDVDKILTCGIYGESQEDVYYYGAPIASATRLGLVQPVTKTSDMTTEVGVDGSGKLWTEAGEGGVPTGGTSGQVLAKKSDTDYDTTWVDQSGGGGLGDWELISSVAASKADYVDIATAEYKEIVLTGYLKATTAGYCGVEFGDGSTFENVGHIKGVPAFSGNSVLSFSFVGGGVSAWSSIDDWMGRISESRCNILPTEITFIVSEPAYIRLHSDDTQIYVFGNIYGRK